MQGIKAKNCKRFFTFCDKSVYYSFPLSRREFDGEKVEEWRSKEEWWGKEGMTTGSKARAPSGSVLFATTIHQYSQPGGGRELGGEKQGKAGVKIDGEATVDVGRREGRICCY